MSETDRSKIANSASFRLRLERCGGQTDVSDDPLSNRLLADLPQSDFDLVRTHLTIGAFEQGRILAEAGEEIAEVHFPLSGMISLLTVLRDGKGIETATIGREGVFGAAAALGLNKSGLRALVQLPLIAATVSARHLRHAAENSKPLQMLCIKYNEVLLAQASITAACNAMHTVEARFCRWLLQIGEVTGSKKINLTHEFLAEMLGVRRASVTEVATKLQAEGIISYTRGAIDMLDLPALRKRSCECFETLKEQNAI
jgi:CRP-like cAMP-binding protein